jgi:UDP-N-acetylglucosamine 4,6-dehydratase
LFDNQSILVTGGTGSFGRRFIKTILERYNARRLIVFSRDEYKQSVMQERYDDPALRYFLGDIRDRNRLMQAMEGVDIVVHAAALKQVPALEYNPAEAIKTNVLGTENVVEAALAHNVAKVIALSTDKAAAPVNLYGATKLTAEKIAISANNFAGQRDTRLSVVRYGNVIGSRGSVIPLFQRLLAEGAAEFPVTDPNMTRFLLTLSPGMPQKVVGIRPGEKLHEVLCLPDTAWQTVEFDRHYVVKPSFKFNRIDVDYLTAANGEQGRPVEGDFSYNSRDNDDYMSAQELRDLIEAAMPFDA